MVKDCSRGITLLKLTTDGHKASRGLSATAELLVRLFMNTLTLVRQWASRRKRTWRFCRVTSWRIVQLHAKLMPAARQYVYLTYHIIC